MIVTKDLTKVYGGVTVLNIPELKIEKGESFGLVGNNGAGKTTYFRLILDLIRADSGYVESVGKDVAKDESWKHYTGSYLDESFLIDFLTPEEYFEFIAEIKDVSSGDLEDFYRRFADFFDGQVLGLNKYVRDLSSGNQKKVGVAAAVMANPEILVLDEPFNSLDPTTQIRLSILLKELRAEKKATMLISSHDLNHVAEVCGRIVILDKGDIVKDIKASKNTLKELEEYFYTQIYNHS